MSRTDSPLGPMRVHGARVTVGIHKHAAWFRKDRGRAPLAGPGPDLPPGYEDVDGALVESAGPVPDLPGTTVPEPVSGPGEDQPLVQDRPVADHGPAHGIQHRPLLPAWVKHPLEHAGLGLIYWSRVALFHAIRLPEYLGRALIWSPRGLLRGVTDLWAYAMHTESRELRHHAAARIDNETWLKLDAARRDAVRIRARVIGAVALAALVLFLVVFSALPASPFTLLGVALVVVVALGAYGAPKGRGFVEQAVVAGPKRVTAGRLVQAFSDAKLCDAGPDGHIGQLTLGQVARDGAGVGAEVRLPGGKTASAAIANREKIAASLDVDLRLLFLERTDSAGRVNVWVADSDPFLNDPSPSPLGESTWWDLWRPIPFGTDHRGRTVHLHMPFTSMLIGAIPRSGKTNALMAVAAAAALDPYVRLSILDAKGGRDWSPFEEIAHFHVSGVQRAAVLAAVRFLEQTVEDMEARYQRLVTFDDDICPENKVTPAITKRPDLNMPLHLICLDDLHRYIRDPQHGKRIVDLLTEILKIGPAAGIMIAAADQRAGTDVIPEDLRGNFGTRFAMRVPSWQASEAILGAGTHKDGLDASEFLRQHTGVGILLGAGDEQVHDGGGDATTLRTFFNGAAVVRRIVAHGHQSRLQAGTLTGVAAGESVVGELADPTQRLLDDVLASFGPDEDKLWTAVIAERLTTYNPDVYAGWTAGNVGAALSAAGVPPKDTWGKEPNGEGRNRKGVSRAAIRTAIEASGRTPRPAATRVPADVIDVDSHERTN